jgi:hypothetical protein
VTADDELLVEWAITVGSQQDAGERLTAVVVAGPDQ